MNNPSIFFSIQSINDRHYKTSKYKKNCMTPRPPLDQLQSLKFWLISMTDGH